MSYPLNHELACKQEMPIFNICLGSGRAQLHRHALDTKIQLSRRQNLLLSCKQLFDVPTREQEAPMEGPRLGRGKPDAKDARQVAYVIVSIHEHTSVFPSP